MQKKNSIYNVLVLLLKKKRAIRLLLFTMALHQLYHPRRHDHRRDRSPARAFTRKFFSPVLLLAAGRCSLWSQTSGQVERSSHAGFDLDLRFDGSSGKPNRPELDQTVDPGDDTVVRARLLGGSRLGNRPGGTGIKVFFFNFSPPLRAAAQHGPPGGRGNYMPFLYFYVFCFICYP